VTVNVPALGGGRRPLPQRKSKRGDARGSPPPTPSSPPPPHLTPQLHRPPSEPTASRPTGDCPSSDAVCTDTDGFTLVTKRPRRANQQSRSVINGVRVGSSLSAAERRKSLFISRLSYKTSEESLSEFIKNELGISDVVCKRLKTKIQGSYSSFHLSVPEMSFEKLMSGESWPSGCIVAPFRGRLNQEQIFKPNDESEII